MLAPIPVTRPAVTNSRRVVFMLWSSSGSPGFGPASPKPGVPRRATERLVHGTTFGTNAVLERKGANVWVITTRGFGDTLDIARTNRTVLYDIRALKPAPLVPRQRVLEVDERMAFDGSVLHPLDSVGVSVAAARIRAAANGGAPGAAVICFLHSYANPSHERAAAALAREQLPGWVVCTSQGGVPEGRGGGGVPRRR